VTSRQRCKATSQGRGSRDARDSQEAAAGRAARKAPPGRVRACPGRQVVSEPFCGSSPVVLQMKKVRRRWHPSSQQISLAIDCAAARMPITRAAELLGVGPRTLWIFVKRCSLSIFDVWQQQDRPSRAKAAHRRPSGCGASLVPAAMHKPWRSRVFIDGRNVNLGYYRSAEEARAAYASAVKAHLGEQYLQSEDQPA
jgi:hypothetical protein